MAIQTLLRASLLGLLLLPALVRADDTDIYINNTPPVQSQPLVMFSIDYRSNLTSTVCSNAGAASCVEGQYFRNNGLSSEMASLGTGKLTLFDVIRFSLKLVLQKVS